MLFTAKACYDYADFKEGDIIEVADVHVSPWFGEVYYLVGDGRYYRYYENVHFDPLDVEAYLNILGKRRDEAEAIRRTPTRKVNHSCDIQPYHVILGMTVIIYLLTMIMIVLSV